MTQLIVQAKEILKSKEKYTVRKEKLEQIRMIAAEKINKEILVSSYEKEENFVEDNKGGETNQLVKECNEVEIDEKFNQEVAITKPNLRRTRYYNKKVLAKRLFFITKR